MVDIEGSVKNIILHKFSTKSREGATFNDLLDSLDSDDERVRALAYYISNSRIISGESSGLSLSSRDISNDAWNDIIKKNRLIFSAFVDTAFSGLPPANVVCDKFLQFWKQYTGAERDVLMGMFLNNRRVPYPVLPPLDQIKVLSDSKYYELLKNVERECRTIDFMLREDTFSDFSPVAWMMIKLVDSIDSFDAKQTFVTACLSAVQARTESVDE